MSNRASIQPVSDLIDLNFLPNELNFIQQGSDFIFDKIYYTNFRKTFIGEGEGWVINMDIVIDNLVAFNFGESGFSIAVNHSAAQDTTQFSFTIEFVWLIKRFLNAFKLDEFSWSADTILEMFKDIFDLELPILLEVINDRDSYDTPIYDMEFLIDIINQEYNWSGTSNEIVYNGYLTYLDIVTQLQNQGINIAQFQNDFEIEDEFLPENFDYEDVLSFHSVNEESVLDQTLEEFIEILNNEYNTTITYTSNTTYENIATELENNSIDELMIISDFVINGLTDLDEIYNNLSEIIGEISLIKGVPINLKTLLLPYLSFSLNNLNLALLFPRTWLKPVDDNGDVISDENEKSMLTYNVGSFYYSSEEGFEFQQADSFYLTRSQIGNTGILIDIHNLKFDFRTDKNIPEATADGRPDSFKGVYVEYAALTLPKRWFNDEDNNDQTTARIAGYNVLIGSGGLSGKIALETVSYINPDGQITDYFLNDFVFNYPIQAKVDNTITGIADYNLLLNYLNAPENKNYQYIYPLSITKADNSELTFNNTVAFHSYLNSLDIEGPRLIKKLGGNGFEIWFTSFDMTFKQGNVTESNIKGGLKIPRLKDSLNKDAEIEIKGHIDDNGGFNITASEQDGFAPLKMPGILELYIQSLEVGRDSNDEPFYVGTSCEIKFTNQIMDKFLDGQRIKIDHMRIYSDGSFEIGAISVPTHFTINLGPVEIAITGINFGSYQEEHEGVMRKYNYFGFDGAISLDPIGVDARGEGIKYYYTTDDGEGKPHHSFMSIKTIGVDLTIPGNASASNATAIIKGWLSINEHEYAGGISLKLPKLKIAGGADMRLQPKPPAFIIDAYLDLPIAIPLAATGLGITGFRGIAGFRYVAEKEAVGLHSHDDTWYDYYTFPERGIHVNKFNGPNETENYTNPVSLGAGVTITTMGSSDVISLRVMVLLSIPNMLLIDGRASILSKQWGLDDSGEPPFFAFLIVADNGIEIGAGLDFKLPQDNGNIIDLHVYMQAGYFWDNPSGWYLNLGTREDPITAKVLKLVEMQSFLMLSATGIEAGAKVTFDIDRHFGPVKIKAWLKIEVGGFISFERPQVGGYLEVDAGARVTIFRAISVGVNFYTFFSAEAAEPFLIYGKVRVCGRIKIGWFKIKKCVNVEFKWERSKQINVVPVPPMQVLTSGSTSEIQTDTVKGIHMLTGETFNLVGFSGEPSVNDARFNEAIIPLDTYIDIKFDKGLLPASSVNSIIGGYNNAPEGYEDLIPPIRVSRSGRELRQVIHQYKITGIEIKASDDVEEWQTYNPYKAVVHTDLLSEEELLIIENLKVGHWQKSSKEYNAIRLLGNSPFSYTQQGEPGWFIPEQLGITAASLFCAPSPKEPKCVGFNDKPVGTWLNESLIHSSNGFIEYNNLHIGAILDLSDIDTSVFGLSRMIIVDDSNIFNINQSVQFDNFADFEIILPNPSVKVDLKLSSNAEDVKVTFYKSYLPDGASLMQYQEIETVNYPLGILDGLEYESTELISKIVISPNAIDQQRIEQIYEEMAQLFIDTHAYYALHPSEFPSEGITTLTLLDSDRFYELNRELVSLYNLGCTQQIPGGDNECLRDPFFCDLYDDLHVIFEECNIQTIEECKKRVEEYLNNLKKYKPRKYDELLGVINRSLTAFYDSTENYLIESFNKMLILIDDKWNCTCQDNSCNRNTIYCDLYNSLYQVSINCTSDIIKCKNDVGAIFKLFLSNYPYESNIINNLLENVSALVNFYNSDEKNIIANLNIILNIIDQEGDCTCQASYTCKTLLHQICWTEKSDDDLNINIPSQEAIEADYLATVDAINRVVEPIWRPNTKYYIHFTLEDEVNGVSTPFEYYYGFKTAGPIGHYHNATGVVYGNQYNPENPSDILNRDVYGKLTNPDEFALTSLNNYIDYKRSYPNANGDLLNSKPLFYGAEESKILLFFIKPYVTHMFKDKWDSYNDLSTIENTDSLQAFNIVIKDPVQNVVIPHPMTEEIRTIVPSSEGTWNEDDNFIMPEYLQFLQNLADGNELCEFSGGNPISPKSEFIDIVLGNLKPTKLYTAIITNTFNSGDDENPNINTVEVHKFVFQTSRYINFEEQVMSFQLKDIDNNHQHDAIFNIGIDVTSVEISKAKDIIDDYNNLDNSEFVDPLDAIIEGQFGIIPLDPPVTTEFNFIKNQSGNTIALWIRNPEPFNDPKIPTEIINGSDDSDIGGTINILNDSDQNDTNYKTLFSKDYSQVLIMHNTLEITASELRLKFKYLNWTGTEYEIKTELDIIEINQINS